MVVALVRIQVYSEHYVFLLDMEELGYAFWDPVCCCQIFRIGFRVSLSNSPHFFFGVSFRTIDDTVSYFLIDM